MIKKNMLFHLVIIALLHLILVSCDQKVTDKAVKADLLTKAKSEKDFAGVRIMVENGVVTLSGKCPSAKSKSTVETTTKGVYGVKSVTNNIIIAPVVIGTDHLLKQGVDSLLKEYAGVQAIVEDSIVTLEGKVESGSAPKLTTAIQSLQPNDLRFNWTMYR
ncbi:MAG TPA: BON domain-containing protein [Segetibacter sp.]|jgi:hypothetical protein